jgi:hypothetical protein
MKVIKNRSNNEELKHCKYFNTHISTYEEWTYNKFEIRANFESNCGAFAAFALNRKQDKNWCKNGCIASYSSYMSSISGRLAQSVLEPKKFIIGVKKRDFHEKASFIEIFVFSLKRERYFALKSDCVKRV